MIDVIRDNELKLFAEAFEVFPVKDTDLVKKAHVEASDWENAPSDMFADEENRMFPIATPADAFMSAVYLYKQAEEADQKVVERVVDALRGFGLDEVAAELEPADEMPKVASDDVFLLRSKRKYPVVDEATLEKSAQAIARDFAKMRLDEKMEVAENLVKVAAEYNQDVPELIKRYARQANCDLDKLAQHLQARYVSTGHDGYKEVMNAVRELYKQAGQIVSDEEINNAIVKAVYDVDKEANPDADADAVLAVYNTFDTGEMEKEAQSEEIEIAGVVFDKNDLEQELEKRAEEIFGEDFVKAAEEMNVEKIDLVKELPVESQEAFVRYIKQFVEGR